jgi:succinate dehydrogenase / fumarate reductase cytochrome b subunit
VIELGLVAFFLVHAIWGILVWLGKRSARPDSYRRSQNAGGASRKTLSSISMIITGPLLLAFVVMHVWMFKYGPSIAQGYVEQVGDHGIRDLHRLVIETFQQPVWVTIYVVVMVLLFLHLRHGFWSAFQSIGVMSSRLTPLVYAVGVILAFLLAAGFILLPVWIFLTGGGA